MTRVKGVTFNLTLTGGWDTISLPTTIRGLMFKNQDTAVSLEYRYDGGAAIKMEAADIFCEKNIIWREPNVEVKGTSADIVDGEYWL